ncbi:MAG: transglutaminaseTgpA domain-containing protein [Myxococcota bacterium]|nr:transglutaminaseTgpA domain-containing protein [Myxococcota bacterium]
MSLGFAYAVGFVLATTTALLTLLSANQLPLWMWLAVFVPAASAFQQARGRGVPTWTGTLVGGLAIVYAAVTLQSLGLEALLPASSGALVGIFLARIITRRTLKHDLQALLVSLLVVIAGAGMNNGVSYGAAFVAYAVSIVWALVTRQLVEGAEREAALPFGAKLEVTLARRDIITPVFFGASAMVSLVVLLSTTLLFVLFPRVGLGSFKLGQQAGLPSAVSLRGSPMARGTGAVVARVKGITFTQFEQGLYMRAATYDRMNRDGFARNEGLVVMGAPPVTQMAHRADARMYEVFMQPVADNRLLVLGPVQSLTLLGGGGANPSMSTRTITLRPNGEVDAVTSGPIRYAVAGPTSLSAADGAFLTEQPLDVEALSAWLTLPEDLDARVPELARATTRGASSSSAKASALRTFLRGFVYTLDLPNGRVDDPLAAFLFDDRRGHCEYFATAFAALLRAAGVPARVVGGFQGGAWDGEAQVAVFTADNAHAWVEWYAEGVGWVLDDATPPGNRGSAQLSRLGAMLERIRRNWDDYVLDYGLSQQFQIFSQVTQGVRSLPVELPRLADKKTLAAIVACCAAVIASAWLWRRRRRVHRRRVHPLAVALQRTLAQVLGEPLAVTRTLRDGVDQATRELGLTHELARALAMALAVYERQRFGLVRGGFDDTPRAIRALRTARRRAPLKGSERSAAR